MTEGELRSERRRARAEQEGGTAQRCSALETKTGRINWRRVLLCGIAAGFVWTILSSLTTAFLSDAFLAAVRGRRLDRPTASLFFTLLVPQLVMGIWAMWLYAAIRPRYGAGPKTALITGFAWWLLSICDDSVWVALGFVPARAMISPTLTSLPQLIISVLVGAWLYRE